MTEHLAQLQRGRRAIGDDLAVEELGRFIGVVLDGLAVQLSAGYPVDVEATLEARARSASP